MSDYKQAAIALITYTYQTFTFMVFFGVLGYLSGLVVSSLFILNYGHSRFTADLPPAVSVMFILGIGGCHLLIESLDVLSKGELS